MIIADTDVMIDHFAGRQPSRARIVEYIQTQQLQTTAINYFELLSGAEGKRANDARQFLASIPVLPLDREAADRAADVRRDLESRGEYIGMGDSLIAGIALTRALPILTRNRKHFKRVPNLKLIELEYNQ